jgi:hypothetical protein
VYLAGTTTSPNGIASEGHQNTYGGGDKDAFLVKFNTNGVRQWGTYYGGSGDDFGYSCAADGSGNVYLAGETGSLNAIAAGGHQNTYGGGDVMNEDAFLVKFNSSGARQWGNYYGGTVGDVGYSCTVDGGDNVYLAGSTRSETTIAAGGYQNTYGGGDALNGDAFLVKFNPSGMRQWGTYYGGYYDDEGFSCATDASGNVYLAGLTVSFNGIAFNGYQDVFGGFNDGYVVKFTASGIRLWGTYFGGEGIETGGGCAVNGSDNVYLTGWTDGYSVLPCEDGYQTAWGGSVWDAYLVKFDGGHDITTAVTAPKDRQQNFSIWPNPSNGGRFFLQTEDTGPAEVQLFDALGQLQRTWHLQLAPGQAPLELKLGSGLAKGMYVVHYTVDGRASTAPLVVQ